MPFLDLDDLTVYYELHGDPDGRPILAISGTGNDLRRSMPDRNPVNAAGHVCHYDQRGLGQADKPPGPYSMADYADDTARVIAAIGWERCAVMGTSFGGMVALNLVVRHPELVDRLVLNCTSPGGDRASFPLDTLASLPADERLDRTMELFDARFDPDAEQPMPDVPRAFYDSYRAGAEVEKTAEELAGATYQLQARSGHDVTDRLADIETPTLVCAGRFDQVAPLANAEFMAQQMPNAELVVCNGGHLFLLQDRTGYERIKAFLTS